MRPPPEAIQHHGTHTAIARYAAPFIASYSEQGLDDIVVPAARPAANLDHAITLARAATRSIEINVPSIMIGQSSHVSSAVEGTMLTQYSARTVSWRRHDIL